LKELPLVWVTLLSIPVFILFFLQQDDDREDDPDVALPHSRCDRLTQEISTCSVNRECRCLATGQGLHYFFSISNAARGSQAFLGPGINSALNPNRPMIPSDF
jgi:hypothetical protein